MLINRKRSEKPGHIPHVAIIGRSMRVIFPYSRYLRERGIQTELFVSPDLSPQAKLEIERMCRDLGVEQLPDDLVVKTMAFAEEIAWCQKIRNLGYMVVDLGDPDARGFSPFYNAEKSIIFGDAGQ
jgi:hypothetical protein